LTRLRDQAGGHVTSKTCAGINAAAKFLRKSDTVNNVKLDPDKVYEAIAKGVDRAIWRMISDNTAMPCRDFYDTIEKAAKEAFEKVSGRANEP
jgi:hypothetical protein